METKKWHGRRAQRARLIFKPEEEPRAQILLFITPAPNGRG
jgi:hypothetical protein